MDKKTAKTIVLVISVLGFIGAGLSIIGGIAMLAMGGMFLGMAQGAGLFAALGWVVALLMLALGVFQIWVYYSLMKYKNWARVLVIVFSVLSLLSWPIGTVIGALMIYFLGFNKDVRNLF